MILAIDLALDPAFGRVMGLPLHWYGAVYSIGFAGVLGWFWLRRARLGWDGPDTVAFTIAVATGILLGGRAFDIAVYELDYYRDHAWQALDWWQGGMASHGVLIGGLAAAALFCRRTRTPLLPVLDELAVPAAFLLAVGRLGNFVEGGVVGTPTALPWGVIHPDLQGPRHPVALYEAAKNLAMVPALGLALRRWPAGMGITAALFVLLYGGLRVVVDQFRDYEAYWLGIGTGQVPNLAMLAAGLGLVLWFRMHPGRVLRPVPRPARQMGWLRPAALVFLLLYPLGIPTSWTAANIAAKRQIQNQHAVSSQTARQGP